MKKLNLVIAQWEAEVDEEAIKLIEGGTPPYEASKRAINRVANRRQRKNAGKSGS